jgi:hypothetical protein
MLRYHAFDSLGLLRLFCFLNRFLLIFFPFLATYGFLPHLLLFSSIRIDLLL